MTTFTTTTTVNSSKYYYHTTIRVLLLLVQASLEPQALELKELLYDLQRETLEFCFFVRNCLGVCFVLLAIIINQLVVSFLFSLGV